MKITISILLCVLVCLTINGQSKIDSCFIQKLAENKDYFSEDGIPPPSVPDKFLFVRGENDSVFLIEDIRGLEQMYHLGQYNMTYKDFLTEALNQNIILHPHYEATKFKLNSKVVSRYKKKGFEAFYKYYCTNTSYPHRDRLKQHVSEKEFNTVVYFLFINNYLVFFDDYIGIYYVGNIITLFKDTCL